MTAPRSSARMDDDLMAIDAKRRYHMDGKTFDSLTKLTTTSTGRRRLVQAAAAAGIGGFLSRGGAAAQDVVTEACQRRQSSCDRDRQCECSSGGAEFEHVVCDQLKKRCNNEGDRCCGRKGATCDVDCDCCRHHRCNSKKKCVKS
jgi:hypothetical protein